jgi:LmbE family N-acetylglucosaminyl deacetylase
MKKILAVFAHPDDESFCAGGSFAHYADKGIDITLLCATRGEAGMSGPFKVNSQKQFGELREKELQKAAEILGIKKVQYLGFIDGTLEKIDKSEIEVAISRFIEKIRPDVLITWDPTGLTYHPDHMVISESATKAALYTQQKIGFPKKIYWSVVSKNFLKTSRIKGMNNKKVEGIDENQITTIIDIKNTLGKKLEALKAHGTQATALREYIKGVSNKPSEECFILVSPRSKKVILERDFFHGI